MKKKIAAVLAFVAVFLTFSGTVYAENDQDTRIVESVQPRYAYTTSIASSLTISGTTATCKSSAWGKDGVTKIEATQYLEKKVSEDEWKTIAHWSASVIGNTLDGMTNTESNLSNGTYRLRTVFVVYMGSMAEYPQKTSPEKTI